MTASERIYILLSDLVGGRVYPLVMPESEEEIRPYIVYSIVSSTPDNTLDGITGHEWVQAQIDVYTEAYDENLLLCSKVVNKLNEIQPAQYGGTRYLFEDGLYRGIVEYEFWQTLPCESELLTTDDEEI